MENICSTHMTNGHRSAEPQYDLFERLCDNSMAWRGCVAGLENARRKLQEIAKKTDNECSMIYLPTRRVVELANVP
jgi:hypothetical protein